MRRRVLDLPNVHVVEHTVAEGLLVDPDGARVTGVKLRSRTTAERPQRDGCDLVVDATGRRSRAGVDGHARLSGARRRAPPRRCPLQHAPVPTRPRRPGGCRHVHVAIPPGQRQGGVGPRRRGRSVAGDPRRLPWRTATHGARGVHRVRVAPCGGPTFTRSSPAPNRSGGGDRRLPHLPSPSLRPAPSVPRSLCRHRRRRLFAQPGLRPRHEHGDPGRSRSSARSSTATAWTASDRGSSGRTRPVIDTAWKLASGADLGDPGVDGRRTAGWRLLNRYINRLLTVAHHDPLVADAFLRVNAMMAPPPHLFRPRIAFRTLRGGSVHGGHDQPGRAVARQRAAEDHDRLSRSDAPTPS